MTPFAARLHGRMEQSKSRVCLGLDPRPRLLAHTHPERHGDDRQRVAVAVTEHLLALLEATHDVVCCCKPQTAFFEALGTAGMEALAQVIDGARRLDLPVIVDAKRSDIGSTAEAYADAYLAAGGPFAGDALTVNAFLGFDSLAPFVDVATATGRGLFVLVKTSNPGSRDLQELELAAGDPLYLRLARMLSEAAAGAGASGGLDDRGYGPLGAVVGATNQRDVVRDLRAALPNSILLLPGYGAQGAGPADVVDAFDSDGFGAVVSASRSLDYPLAAGGSLSDSVRASRAAAEKMRDDIQRALAERG